MEFPKKIADALHRERPFPLLRYANDAWTLTREHRSSFIGASFIYFVFAIVAVFLASLVMALFGGSLSAALSVNVHPSGIQVFLNALLLIGLMLLAIPIPAGYTQAAHTATTEGYIPFNDFFAGYESGKWTNLIVTYLLQLFISYLVIFAVSMLVGASFFSRLRGSLDVDNGEIFGVLLFFIIGAVLIGAILAVRAIYMWSTHITYFFDLRGWNALEASRKLIGWNFIWIILFDFSAILFIALLLTAVAAIVTLGGTLGIILFIIFYLFVLMLIVPFFLNFQYVAFADTVRLNEEENDGHPDEDRIIDHFMPE